MGLNGVNFPEINFWGYMLNSLGQKGSLDTSRRASILEIRIYRPASGNNIQISDNIISDPGFSQSGDIAEQIHIVSKLRGCRDLT
jgi:hypothetical protein